ncbi:trypco2 family protein [Streptomyces olivaceoviridis]|uniref:trypco2 family protein n=1 Tax=Streptomyces olivaceoviridis TaxID=1921 RepID=UPI00332B8891
MSSTAHTNGDAWGGIELKAAIAALHEQLVGAADASSDREVRFEVGPIQMEFAFELRREAKGSGKLKAWVLEGGIDTSRATGHIHRVTFTLNARNAATGRPTLIGNSDRGSFDGIAPPAP